MRITLKTMIASVCLMAAGFAASAAGTNAATTPQLQVSLVAEQSVIAAGQPFTAGFDFKLQPGWHVYWINPGDSGQPPNVKWGLPEGFHAGDFQWPKPEKITVSTLADYGYSNEVLLMTPMQAGAGAKGNATLQADLHWLVCREVCIPGKAQLALTLPVAAREQIDPKTHELFEKTRREIPPNAPAQWSASTEAGANEFVLTVKTGRREEKAAFYPLQESQVDNPAAQPVDPTSDGVRLHLKKSEYLTGTPTTLQGLLITPTGAFVVDAPVTAVAGAAQGAVRPPVPQSLGTILGLAFLGGVILNLMPCVFPVLSLKMLGLSHLGHGERQRARVHGLFYTLGILASFWVLAGVLLALRAAGHEIGWGFQMQSPTFVVVMSALLFLLGMNLLGVFEVGLAVMGAGSGLAAKEGYSGSFFTGVLATVVATPCTAPFMGAAVGYAVTQSAAVSLLVFTMLALGLAAPYVILTLEPRWAKALPKPGEWMLRLKQGLSFPLFAAVIWLVWVFGQQQGMDAVARLLGGLLLVGAAGWVYGQFRSRVVRDLIALGLLGAGLWLPITAGAEGRPVSAATAGSAATSEGIAWEGFTPAKLSEYRAQGKPVLVDFTAAWCLSCQVNERAVFHATDIQQRLRDSGVVLMKADWTSYDPEITRTLQQYGRSGVPYYVMYGKGAEPVLATELLTQQMLLEAVGKAKQ